jgi:hypothetical protein
VELGYFVFLTVSFFPVEEHFRKSLGDDRFKQIQNAQQKQEQKQEEMDTTRKETKGKIT